MENTSRNDMVQTKLQIPQPHPGTIQRTRLLSYLDEGLKRRATLITAPAGFGKSTLLITWIHSLMSWPNPPLISWISLETRDNDPYLFWSYIIAALQRVIPNIGMIGAKLLNSSQPSPIEYVTNSLINDLAKWSNQNANSPDHPGLIIILDDYQEVQSSLIDDALTYFFENLPWGVHGIIASRRDPDLPLARWRARDEITEIRSHDLRFLPHETEAFFRQTMNMEVSEDVVNKLEERTEGWITGLQLAALSLRGHANPAAFIESFSGTHRHILDYLVLEVLDRLSEDERAFLFHTSILQRLHGPLCDAVTLGNNSQFILERFDRQNLFVVPLDEDRRWYRYHNLFAETLQSLWQRSDPSTERTFAFHHRAAIWYQEHKMMADAIDHALAAKDYPKAAHWIEEEMKLSIFRSSFYTLRHWLEKLPEEMIHSSPWLCLSFAGALLGEARFHEVEPWLQVAEANIGNLQNENQVHNPRGLIDAIRATVAINFGDEDNAILLSQSAIQNLSEKDHWARAIVTLNLGDAYSARGEGNQAIQAFSDSIRLSIANSNHTIASVAMASLGILQARQGHLRLAEETLTKAAELPDSAPFSGKAAIYLSEIYLEWNLLEKAERWTQHGIMLCQQWGHQEHLLDGLLVMANIQWAKGNLTELNNCLNQAEAVLRHNLNLRINSSGGPRGQQIHWRAERLAEFKAQISIMNNDLVSAASWANQRKYSVNSVDPWRSATYVKLLIAETRYHDAHTVLHRIIETTQNAGLGWPFLHASVLLVMLLHAENRMEEAQKLLIDILVKAKEEKYCRLFINEGDLMIKLLRTLASYEPIKAYVQKLLHEADRPQLVIKPQNSFLENLPEPLTERELEILCLLAAGKTNAEIASKLYLAIGTVKKHVNNIYGKLGVKTRTQALLKAGEVGLV